MHERDNRLDSDMDIFGYVSFLEEDDETTLEAEEATITINK